MRASSVCYCALLAAFLINAPSAHADPFSARGSIAGWPGLIQALLAGGLCQNRLNTADRANCFKRNAAQACIGYPEGVEQDNCIQQLSEPTDRPSPLRLGRACTDYRLENVSPVKKSQAQLPAVKTDDLDSSFKSLLTP